MAQSKIAMVYDHGVPWVALYRDGKKVLEGEFLNVARVFEVLKLDVERIEIDAGDDDAESAFPEDLEDLER